MDYRLSKTKEASKQNQVTKRKKRKSSAKISALPLVGANRKNFIKTVNLVFEKVLERIEPEHPDLVRKLWNAEDYIDDILLEPKMLPINRDYALSLIDAFLVHHIIELASKTDYQDLQRI